MLFTNEEVYRIYVYRDPQSIVLSYLKKTVREEKRIAEILAFSPSNINKM